ncbi:Fc receptor-like protein 5 [Centropristis striata]|uniref:Fc receptor-like protein 5 n=1 Tax=Centropristis striata TaxID=184440 RepID=UPI0027E024D8|nr:Fc receptor-like protein 5 [Centropristis striata]
MGHTLLGVLGFFSLNILFYCGHAQDVLLTIEPNWSTVFTGESVTFMCDTRGEKGDNWYYSIYRGDQEFITNNDRKNHTEQLLTTGFSGEYQCRAHIRGSTIRSNKVSLTVSDKDVILETPASSLFEGESVTLGCRHRDPTKNKNAVFYKDGSAVEMDTNLQSQMMKNTVQVISNRSSSYMCKFGDEESEPIQLKMEQPEPVLTVSPSWLSPGDSVTLNCRVKHPSAGWRFSWYKAVPKPSDNSYSYELLPDSTTGTEQDSYIVHGQTHTAGYVCRAGRGDPVYHTDYSQPQFVWSGDFGSSASLTVSPDRVQHFTSDSVSLSCEGNSTEWRVRRFTDGYLSNCSIWGTMTGPTCKVDKYLSSGVYWCESGTGEFSNAVNITLTYENIILLSPVRPVTEGRSVTLGCKLKTQNYIYNVVFYKNGKIIQNDTRGELIISAVSKSDEGFYNCKGDNSPQGWSVTSRESWMSVKSASRPENNPPFPVLLVVGLVGGVLLIILLLLFLLLCCYRKSKDSCFNRSQRSNQSPATDQDGSQHTGCASTLQGDVCHYESIKDINETENDKSRDATYSVIELKNMRKDDEAHQNALYCGDGISCR